MAKKIIPLLFLFGCSSESFCYAGLCFVSDRQPTEQEVGCILNIADRYLAEYYPQEIGLRGMIADNPIGVWTVSGELVRDCVAIGNTKVSLCEKALRGVNIEGHTIYMEYAPTLNDMPFVHELLHSWERYILNIDPPKDHSTRGLFSRYSKEKSVETRTEDAWYIECMEEQ